MRFSATTTAFAAVAALPLALAQTSTSCNPMEKSCPSDPGLPASSYTVDFTSGSGSNSSWTAAAYSDVTYGSDGAVFSIGNKNQAPTISTDFYVFFGKIDVVMKAAPGTGIVSSIVLESDDLDEIDWEFLGGSDNQVQSDFFGKGNTTTYNRAQYHNVADTQGTWHTYTVDWSSEQIQWLIDGSVVRTLPYSDSLTLNGQNFPQTPMRLKLGNWCGGCSSAEGTVSWAGGQTTFGSQPYNMYVKSVTISNSNPACSYQYGDQTGSYESIKVLSSGDSCSAPSASSSQSGSSTATGSSSSATGNSSIATGNTTLSTSVTAAPTSSLAVVALSQQSGVVASTTITGSAYSTDSASISKVNALATASTQVPSPASRSSSKSSSSAVSQPSTGAASSFSASASSLAFGLFAFAAFLL